LEWEEGGRNEQDNRLHWRVAFADGVELEVTGPRRCNQKLTAGHARSIAIDYLRRTGRTPSAIASTVRLPQDAGRHAERAKQASRTLDNARADLLKYRHTSRRPPSVPPLRRHPPPWSTPRDGRPCGPLFPEKGRNE
jgi:hypothetical protein